MSSKSERKAVKCRKWLIFPNHNWSKWEDYVKGFASNNIPVTIQSRKCNNCGRKQLNIIYPSEF